MGTLGLPKHDRDRSRLPDHSPQQAPAPTAAPHEGTRYVRLRCLEAAARNPDPRHADGMAASVLAMAKEYAAWVLEGEIGT